MQSNSGSYRQQSVMVPAALLYSEQNPKDSGGPGQWVLDGMAMFHPTK